MPRLSSFFKDIFVLLMFYFLEVEWCGEPAGFKKTSCGLHVEQAGSRDILEIRSKNFYYLYRHIFVPLYSRLLFVQASLNTAGSILFAALELV